MQSNDGSDDMDLNVTIQDLTVKHKVHDMDLYVTVQDLTVKHKVHVQHGIVCQVMDILSTFCHEFMVQCAKLLVVVVIVSGMQLSSAWRHTSTSSSTEGSSEPNLLLRGA